jgi:hypothetical protein
LKKLIMLAAILALALAAAVPAIAQVALEAGNEAESDDVALEFSVANEGNYASQCTPATQIGNTGNLNNTQVFQQYASKADDFEAGGIGVGFGGSVAAECGSTIQQSSAASGW